MAQGVRPVGTEGPEAGGVAGGRGQTPTPGRGQEAAGARAGEEKARG